MIIRSGLCLCLYAMVNDWGGGYKVLWCDLNCVVCNPCCLCVVVVVVECGAFAFTNAFTCILIPGIYESFGIFLCIYNL